MSSAQVFKAIAIVILGVALAVVGIYIGDTDDAPGASLIGILLLVGSIVIAYRILRGRQQRGPQ